MAAPAAGRCGAEEEEDFHDCQEEPESLQEEEEEEFVILEKEQEEEEEEEAAVEQEGVAAVAMEMREPSPGAEQPASAAIEDERSSSPAMEGRCEEEWDEEALLEMEKQLSEEEREERKKESAVLKEEGNTLFKNADYAAAEEVYSLALQKCPAFYKKDRSILFSNRAAARLKQDKKDFALKDCSKAIELNPDYIRALLRRAELYERTEKLDEALADYQAVLERDVSCHQARDACMRLPKQIEERNEKMKEEMMSKLKDLGNLVLKPFGLSTNNFQVNQDPQTGSYSINFVQKSNNNR